MILDHRRRFNHAGPHPGVAKVKRKTCIRYETYIDVDKKRHYLGTFKTIEEAIAARKAAEKKYWGEHEKRLSGEGNPVRQIPREDGRETTPGSL
jgi:hypothetical protein